MEVQCPSERRLRCSCAQYERIKSRAFMWDIGDLTAHVLEQLEAHGFPAAARFDFL